MTINDEYKVNFDFIINLFFFPFITEISYFIVFLYEPAFTSGYAQHCRFSASTATAVDDELSWR